MPGDVRHARCRYCCVLLNAHRNDLLKHCRSSKHAVNVAFGQPYSDDDITIDAVARSAMKLSSVKNERLTQKKSRFSKLALLLLLLKVSTTIAKRAVLVSFDVFCSQFTFREATPLKNLEILGIYRFLRICGG